MGWIHGATAGAPRVRPAALGEAPDGTSSVGRAPPPRPDIGVNERMAAHAPAGRTRRLRTAWPTTHGVAEDVTHPR
ncbi:hypothetical protein ACF1G5_02620 [Streptomyces coeruleorubidus]|uniref:hypothetical protein n=1 Tax=Streptomyces coeruleorubidus TaxID=116188 RepID=UPI0036F8E377